MVPQAHLSRIPKSLFAKSSCSETMERNGSSLIAFTVGMDYEAGNGASMIACHVDALSARLKPIPTLPSKAGYIQLGVAPYAGGLNTTWFDRDLGIGGRILVKDNTSGKIETKLVKLGWPIARIPTLAPHFGAAASLANVNKETQMVPIIGLDESESGKADESTPKAADSKTFAATQPPRLVKVIAEELGIEDCKLSAYFLADPQLTICRFLHRELGIGTI